MPRLRFAFEDVQNLSHSRNVGLALAQGDVTGFMDDDAIAEPSWVKSLVEAFELRPDIGCVGGPVKPIWPAATPAWLTPFLAGYLSILDLGDEPKELAPGEWLAGCNIAYDRRALFDSGGFRVDLGRSGNPLSLMSNEETAAWQKLRKTGKKILYTPHAVVSHHIKEERLNASWLSRRIVWQAVSDVISDPEYSKAVANSGTRSDVARTVLELAMRLVVPRKHQRPLTDDEALRLHRFVSYLLCKGIG